jgi:hypothetical protein
MTGKKRLNPVLPTATGILMAMVMLTPPADIRRRSFLLPLAFLFCGLA